MSEVIHIDGFSHQSPLGWGILGTYGNTLWSQGVGKSPLPLDTSVPQMSGPREWEVLSDLIRQLIWHLIQAKTF